MKLTSLLVFLSLLVFSEDTFSQPFEIGHTTLVFHDSNRNRNISTEIYYPADTPGEDVAVAAGSFSVIVFGHGFLMAWEAYQNFWEALVPKGYVMCFPTTETGITPSHENLGLDLAFLATTMQQINADSTSLFFHSLTPKTALMGHSMGGGASFLAAKNNASIHTLVNFAAAETTPSAISAAKEITVPALVFSGDDDCVAPPTQHQDLMYDSLASACKTHIAIKNGGHCYFANNNFNCTLGEAFCNPTLDITRAAQQSATVDFLSLWLAYTLYDDQQAFGVFNDSLQTSTRINSSQFCAATSIQDLMQKDEIALFPNPVMDQITLALPKGNTEGRLTIYSPIGERVFQQFIHKQETQIEVSFLPEGTFIVIYVKDGYTYSRRLIKLGRN